MSVAQTAIPVQIDQVFDMFNQPTRTAIAHGLQGFGDTLASRGSSLNETIEDLPPLLSLPAAGGRVSERAADSVDAAVHLAGRVHADGRAAVAGERGSVHEHGDHVRGDRPLPGALESTIARVALDADDVDPVARGPAPFLTDFTSLGRELQPATEALRRAAGGQPGDRGRDEDADPTPRWSASPRA